MEKKHLTLDDRIKILGGLNQGKSFKSIARETVKSCTTISREIRKHMKVERKGAAYRSFNDCIHRKSCTVMNGECERECTKLKCSFCAGFCMTEKCSQYKREECSKLLNPPYVCNGCAEIKKCTLEKHFYEPKLADDEYRELLSECRSGFSISEEDAQIIGETLENGLSKGQSVYHIMTRCGGEESFGCTAKTIYTYIDAGILGNVANIDLPRKVKFKPRKKGNSKELKKDRMCRIGRTYTDFLCFREDSPDVAVVEMDSVEGKKGIGQKVLLTLHFVTSKLQLAFIRDANTACSVEQVFNGLKEQLGLDCFKMLFPVILTDNGCEFSDPLSIELQNDTGELLTHVFYCDARQPGQKGACENNHTLIRKVIPKGVSLNNLTQADIDKMMSHINSYLRKELGGKCPIDMFEFMYGQNILNKLNISKIPPKDVNLTPSLWDR